MPHRAASAPHQVERPIETSIPAEDVEEALGRHGQDANSTYTFLAALAQGPGWNQVLGHSSLVTIQRNYAQSTPADAHETLAKLLAAD
jgi:hypothetical protein